MAFSCIHRELQHLTNPHRVLFSLPTSIVHQFFLHQFSNQDCRQHQERPKSSNLYRGPGVMQQTRALNIVKLWRCTYLIFASDKLSSCRFPWLLPRRFPSPEKKKKGYKNFVPSEFWAEFHEFLCINKSTEKSDFFSERRKKILWEET